MLPEEIRRVCADSPASMAIYEPLIIDDLLTDMILRWSNPAMSWLAGERISDHHGAGLTTFAENAWNALRIRFGVLIATGVSFNFAGRFPLSGRDYEATAWLSGVYVGVLIREISDPEMIPISDITDVGSVLRMMEMRTRRTLELAQLLIQLQGSATTLSQ